MCRFADADYSVWHYRDIEWDMQQRQLTWGNADWVSLAQNSARPSSITPGNTPQETLYTFWHLKICRLGTISADYSTWPCKDIKWDMQLRQLAWGNADWVPSVLIIDCSVWPYRDIKWDMQPTEATGMVDLRLRGTKFKTKRKCCLYKNNDQATTKKNIGISNGGFWTLVPHLRKRGIIIDI